MILYTRKFQTGNPLTSSKPIEEPGTIENPNYRRQLELYRNTANNKPMSRLSATMDADMLAKWTAHRDKHYPEERGLPITKVVYDPDSVDKSTGLPTQFLDYYGKPSQYISGPTKPAPTAAREYFFLNPHTREKLDPEIYGRPEGNMDVQFSQGAELITRKLENIEKDKNQRAQSEENKALIKTMTPEQLADMKAKKMAPNQYLATNTVATKRDGGIIVNDARLDSVKDNFLPPSSKKRKSLLYKKT